MLATIPINPPLRMGLSKSKQDGATSTKSIHNAVGLRLMDAKVQKPPVRDFDFFNKEHLLVHEVLSKLEKYPSVNIKTPTMNFWFNCFTRI
ncbi:hypothetical protein Scep_001733 [Stephania cephalantha]|uniref:Uncharacterized protein n=1 Tax=Stephania cephalantha TaxID=152367 RepID=A0AAP0Q818_9MAGN